MELYGTDPDLVITKIINVVAQVRTCLHADVNCGYHLSYEAGLVFALGLFEPARLSTSQHARDGAVASVLQFDLLSTCSTLEQTTRSPGLKRTCWTVSRRQPRTWRPT